MQKITKHIIKAIEKGMKIEKSKHPDWDENKHRMKVVVNLDDDKIQLDFTKENK